MQVMDERERQCRIAASRAGRRAAAAGDSTAWFDPLYRAAREADAPADIPWVDQRPNRFLMQWLDRAMPAPCRACVVGCGLGDDAEELARRGFNVTAFDISPTAIDWCRERHAATAVDYAVADFNNLPAAWRGAFDLVVEVYNVQALPLAERAISSAALSSLVARGGRLVAVCRGRSDEESDPKGPPWPFSPKEMALFATEGMTEESFEIIDDPDDEGVVRFLGVYRRVPAD